MNALTLIAEHPAVLIDLAVNGLLIGAIFVLTAYGMALVWGVMNIINIVQGEFVMLGGFITLMTVSAGAPPFLGLPAAALLLFALGWALHQTVIFRVVDRDPFISLLATFGLSILIQQFCNQIFGADVRTVDAGLGTFFILGGTVAVPAIKFIAFLLAIATGVTLWLFLQRARLGRAIRATAQNPQAARILGIDTRRVHAATYALNAALCGAAGSLVVMAWAIHPYIGLPYTVRSFMIVIVAGLGNMLGVVIAGLGLGAAENIAGFIFGSEYQIAFVFVLMIAILVWRNFSLARQRKYLR